MEDYKNWIQIARDDLNWTKHNLEGKIYYGACFTAQQAAEKILKAFLLANNQRLRKIHDLRALLEDCILINKDFEKLRKDTIKITPYYVQTRYPADLDLYSSYNEMQAKDAYESAKRIVKFVERKIP